MKNLEASGNFTFTDLVGELEKGQFAIPDFQREFAWEPWDIVDLLKSIFMDYYIGTLLLWKSKKQNIEILKCENIYGGNLDNDPKHIVLDGQQRLTALNYSILSPNKPFPRRKSKCYFFVNVKKLLNEDYDDNVFFYYWESKWVLSLLNDTDMQFKEDIMPISILKDPWDIQDWLSSYKAYKQNNDLEFSAGDFNYLKELFKELLTKYKVAFIELDRDIEISKVCDIFTKLNSKGVPLNIFDLLNAILRPHDIYLKEMWRTESPELEFTDSNKMRIYVLQVMSVILQTYCSGKYLYYLVPSSEKVIKNADGSKSKIVLISSKEEFKSLWDESALSIKNTISKLKNPRDFGAVLSKFVPYPSMIPIISSIYSYLDNNKVSGRLKVEQKIWKWYWASVFTQNYSSSVESQTAKDFSDLKKWFADDTKQPEIIDLFIKSYKDLALKSEVRQGTAIYNAIINLLIIKGAKDWDTFSLPEYSKLDDHHIVPYSWGKKEVGSDINTILNKTPLSPDTNRTVVSDKMPNEYIAELINANGKDEVIKLMNSHLISEKALDILLRVDFSKSDYYEFIEERYQTIINHINNTIIEQTIEVPNDLKQLDAQIEEIEIKIRYLISSKLKDIDKIYKNYVPSFIQEKINRRIISFLKKNPSLAENSFASFHEKLQFFDLQELYQIITNKSLWEYFEHNLKNKEQLMNRFVQMGDLRNSIRHSRIATDICKLDGKAAIEWFKSLL